MRLAEPTPQVYAAEYAACRLRIRALLEMALADAASAPDVADTIVPACPDWTVRNLCAHLAGVPRDLVARNNPGADPQAWVDRQVAERADRDIPSLLDEWDEFSPGFEQLIMARPQSFAGLLLDIVAHEHDLSHALDLEADRTSTGLRAAMFMEAVLLTRDLGRLGLPAVRVSAGGVDWVCGEGEPELVLDLGDGATAIWELTRVLGSRRSFAQLATLPWQGDWQRFLPALAHMPLPDDDLVE